MVRINRSEHIFMMIQKQYEFYAAHRNETLVDKCRNLHGHRYGILCHFEVEREGDISTLFGDFDSQIEPWLKENYDHGMLININDPLHETLQQHINHSNGISAGAFRCSRDRYISHQLHPGRLDR